MRCSCNILHFLLIHSVYCFSNFVPLFILAAAYVGLKYHNPVALGFLGLCFLDMVVPLKLPGLWVWWCKMTNTTQGKKDYFPLTIEYDGPEKLDMKKNYMLCGHPHSLYFIPYDVVGHFMHEKFGVEILGVGASVLLQIPLLRRALTWWGMNAATRESMTKLLQLPYPRNVLVTTVGGISEMFYGTDSVEQIVAKRRKGHIRLALQNGASIIPVYGLGANSFVYRVFGPESLAARVSRKLRVSLVLWLDRFNIPYGIFPIASPIVVAIGPPIDVQKVPNPTEAQVDELHAKYLQSYQELFDRHKSKLGTEWAKKTLLFEDGTSRPKTS